MPIFSQHMFDGRGRAECNIVFIHIHTVVRTSSSFISQKVVLLTFLKTKTLLLVEYLESSLSRYICFAINENFLLLLSCGMYSWLNFALYFFQHFLMVSYTILYLFFHLFRNLELTKNDWNKIIRLYFSKNRKRN